MKMLSAVVMTGLLAGFTAAPVQAYELDGSKWPEGQSAFHYDLRYKGSASSPSGKSWNSAFRDAANAWNDQTAFRFTLDTQAIDFGTSQSPKSTRPLTTYSCRSRPGHQALHMSSPDRS